VLTHLGRVFIIVCLTIVMLKYSVLTFAAGMSSVVVGSRCGTGGFCTLATTAVQTTSNYAALEEKLKEINKLAGIDALLGWDQMVMLPTESSTARNDQKSALASIIYEKKTSNEMKTLIADLIGADLSVLPSDFERAVVRDAEIIHNLAVRQTKEMTVRQAELDGRGYQIWAGNNRALQLEKDENIQKSRSLNINRKEFSEKLQMLGNLTTSASLHLCFKRS
jgi:Carboxypeptidase Taq (M32) metallopeptidase